MRLPRAVVTGWRRRVSGITLRSLPTRAFRLFLIAAYCISAWGFSTTSLGMSGGAFPCAGHQCGCATAAQCWKQCCCYTPGQRQAWATLHGMHLPDSMIEQPAPPRQPTAQPAHGCCSTKSSPSAISPTLLSLRREIARGDATNLCRPATPPAANTTASGSGSSSSCCSKKANTAPVVPVAIVQMEPAKSCCSTKKTPTTPATPAPPAPTTNDSEESTEDGGSPLLRALKCRGAGSAWTMLTEPLATPPAALCWQPWSAMTSDLIGGDLSPCEVSYARLTPPG